MHNNENAKNNKVAKDIALEVYSPSRSPVCREDYLVRDVNKDGIGTVIEVEEIKYDPLESPSKDPFQKKKMKHWLFHYEQDKHAIIRSPRGNAKKEKNIRPMTAAAFPIPSKKHIPRNHSENKILKFDGLYEPNSLELEDISCPEGRKFHADNDFEKKLFDHDNQIMPKYNHPASNLHDIKPTHVNTDHQPKMSEFRIKSSDLHPQRQNISKTVKYNIITNN